MIKIIFIFIIGVVCFVVVCYLFVIVVNVYLSVIVCCFVDNLFLYGYILDFYEIDISGISKEFIVYYCNGVYIVGIFWIVNLMIIVLE